MKRTNVEIRPEQIAKLKEIAAKRGERGYAKILAEAIDAFIGAEAAEEQRRAEAIAMKGVLDDEEAESIRTRIEKGRKQAWPSSRMRT